MTKRVILTAVILGLLVFGTVSPVLATVDFNAYIPISGNPITPSFKFSKSVYLDYPNGGKLKDALNGKNITVAFNDSSTNNPSIKSFMDQINSEIISDRKSTATITNLAIEYKVTIIGDVKHASFDYLMTLTPTMTGYILQKGDSTTPTVVDISWMGFTMKNPTIISTQKYGDLEINFPLGIIKNQLPDVYSVLKGTQAESALNANMIDSSSLTNISIEKWDSLFDPAYTLTETAGYGYQGKKVAVTTFSAGQSGLTEGALKVVNIDQDFTADVTYHLSAVDRAGSGTITVDGHANGYSVQGEPAISTQEQASTTTGISTAGGLSTMTIYAMAAFAVVIAGGVFFWSNRKMKQAINRVQEPSRPIEYETRQHWADKFDGQPSGSSGQPSNSDDKTKRSAI